MKCKNCGVLEQKAPLCEECFYEEFERATGVKPVWEFNKDKQEWEQVYVGIGLRDEVSTDDGQIGGNN